MTSLLPSASFRTVFCLCWAATSIRYSLGLRISGVSSLQRTNNFQSAYRTRSSLFASQLQSDDNKIGLSFFDKLLKSAGGFLQKVSSDDGKNRIQKSLASSSGAIRRIPKKKVIIIGTGMSGLACAKELLKSGCTDFLILDSADAPGGRVRTDKVDGYLLDRGFQVFIDSYPESISLFDSDYSELNLKPFLPGALVHFK